MALPIVAGGDEEASQAYNDAIKNALEALSARQQPNYFTLAGALLNPGRTGNVGEALGSAANVLGQQQTQQEAQAPQLAILKAQLAGQQYEVANRSKALGMVSNLLGPEIGTTNPQEVQAKLESGDVPSSAFTKLTPEAMAMIGTLDKSLGDTIFKAGSAAVDREKVRQQEMDRAFKLKYEIPYKESEAKARDTELGFKAGEQGQKLAQILIDSGPAAYAQALSIMGQQKGTIAPTAPAAAAPAAPTASMKPSVDLPVQGGRISSPFGVRPSPFNTGKQEFHSGVDIAGPEGSPVNALIGGVVKSVGPSGGFGNRVEVLHKDGSTSYYAHLKDATVKLGDVVTPGQPVGTLGSTGMSTGPHVEFGIHHQGQPIDPQSVMSFKGVQPVQAAPTVQAAPVVPAANAELAGLPIKAQNEIISGRITKADEQWKDHVADIISATPMDLNRQNSQIAEVMTIAKRNPQIFNILGQSSWWAGMKNAVDEGVHTGSFGSISLPIQKFEENSKLTKNERDDLITVQRNLGDIYLSSIKERGKVLGSNPTNFEDRLYRVPMATEKDPASSVLEWGQKHLLLNKAKEALFDAYGDYTNRPGTSPSKFFLDKQSPYRQIVNNYNKFYKELQSNR